MKINFGFTKQSVNLNIYAFCTFIYLAGIYLVPEYIKYFSLFYIGIVVTSAILKGNTNITSTPTVYLWILYIALGLIFSLVYGIANMDDSFEHIVALAIGFIVQNVYYNKETQKKILNAIFYVSVIAFIGCVIQLVIPGLLIKILPYTLGPTKFSYFYNNFFQYGFLVGFSYQTGVTGYYLGIFSGYLLCNGLFNKRLSTFKKLLCYLFFAMGYVFILLAGKRGEMLVVLMLTLILVFMKYRHKIANIVLITLVLLVGVFILLNFTEMGQDLLERTFTSDPTTGRSRIYKMLMEAFSERPIFGNGFTSTLSIVVGFTNGHNIYLQVLTENGIVGLTILLIIFICNLVEVIKALKKSNDTNFIPIIFCLYLQIHFLILGMFGNPLYDVYPLIAYMISVGVIQSIKTIRSRYEVC
ncbi:MAG: O-antigen ligase family protein [Clostridia bacterium]|nr:O-antigen ligase family protein [Clostridia bacterium]